MQIYSSACLLFSCLESFRKGKTFGWGNFHNSEWHESFFLQDFASGWELCKMFWHLRQTWTWRRWLQSFSFFLVFKKRKLKKLFIENLLPIFNLAYHRSIFKLSFNFSVKIQACFRRPSIHWTELWKYISIFFYNLKRVLHSLIDCIVSEWNYRKLISVILMLNIVKCICLLSSSLTGMIFRANRFEGLGFS